MKLGEKIRQLRRRDGRTQEDLARALGVTGQAVSRWEANGGYPDMEMLPAIANYFGVTIDELFGYQGERSKKIDALLRNVNLLDEQNLRSDQTLDRCIQLLREGLAEFPGNERIMQRLAQILAEAGWERHHEWMNYGADGYIRYEFDRHKKNPYWMEAIRLYETLVSDAADGGIRTNSICELVRLYRIVGEQEKAVALARQLPPLEHSREIILASATDGKSHAKYLGEVLLKLAYQFAEQLVYALVVNKANFETDMPVRKVEGAIAVFNLICEDGNLGIYHREVAYLYLYLSRLQWEQGWQEDAFESLDAALHHAKAYDALAVQEQPRYTAALVKLVTCEAEDFWEHGMFAQNLSEDWPMWCNPDYTKVKQEMTADPRWEAWVKKTREKKNEG